MTETHLRYGLEDHAAYITIDREARRNAITAEMTTLFLEYLDRAEQDDAVRVVVITGAGHKAFCAGADLAGGMGHDTAPGGSPAEKYAQLLKRLAGFSKPLVARVNGTCLAGGTGFMLACDVVIASRTAKFGTPEVNVGLFPMMIGALIYRNVPRKRAMEMILLGGKLSADEALEMGMLTRVVPPEELDEAVNRVVKALASKSPIGMKMGKRAFYEMEDMPFENAVDFLSEQLMAVASTEDAVEGITAFLEKRTPVFKGK